MKKPFVGLRPFRKGENGLFFGRDRDIAILQNLIRAVPVLVVYAPSGTGKSSLLNAGVLPAIEQDPFLLPVVVDDPRADVTASVSALLVSTGWHDAKTGDGGLAATLQRHFTETDRRLILVLDQFEERLKDEDSLDELYIEIARLANTRSEAATVVISVREDYLAGLERLMRRVSGLLDASFRVPALSKDALSDAVYGPLKAVATEVGIEAGLVGQVLTDLEREARLGDSADGRIEAGYFQIVWSHLWDKDADLPDHRLTSSTYQREGGAAGILESFVSSTLSRLLPFELEVLSAVIRYLVLPTGAKVSMTIDDLLGLLRRDDFTKQAVDILPLDDRWTIRKILDSLFSRLTRTETPLFRRVLRGQREEYELVHDLLGPILLQWRTVRESEEDATARKVVQRVVSEYTGLAKDAYASVSNRGLLTDPKANREGHGVKEALTAYIRDLAAVETAADAELAAGQMRAGFGQLAWIRRHLWVGPEVPAEMGRVIQPAIGRAYVQLKSVALGHPSRDVQRATQRQAYEFQAFNTYFEDLGPWITESQSNRARSAWMYSLAYATGLAFAVGGMFIAYRLLRLVWHVPDIEYLKLTLGTASCGMALMYLINFYPNKVAVWETVRDALWPTSALPDSVPSYGGERSSRLRYLQYSALLTWWPILFAAYQAICFSIAVVFDRFGWSATAGFNLAAVLAAFGVAVAYVWASDG
ncbi:ATP-binding protein [Kribbella sp. NBC_00482]|uniref:ATP-binding protein n=1 Tax=Kribbella sp. NBC_00482 TaxID=2975968 RepID=UPI002E180F28